MIACGTACGIASGLVALSPIAAAEGIEGTYLIGEYGTADMDAEGIEGAKDSMMGFGVGYEFNENMAVEATYSDFGSISNSFDTNNDNVEDLVKDVESSAIGFSLIGSYWTGKKWAWNLRLGLDVWSMDIADISDSGVATVWGGGGTYAFSDKVSIRGELATRAFKFDDELNAEVNTWKLSLLYKL